MISVVTSCRLCEEGDKIVIMTILWETIMADILVPVHELKAKLSEYLGRTLHRKERIIISRRNKPIAMIIPVDQEGMQKDVTDSSGLEKVDWSGFSELADSVEAVYEGRQGEGYREVSF